MQQDDDAAAAAEAEDKEQGAKPTIIVKKKEKPKVPEVTEELPRYSYKDAEFATAGAEETKVAPSRVYVRNSEEAEELLGCLKR